MNRKDFEIMAPVGSYESLYAAIQGGADAIYFGIEGLNMRARSANNFTTDDLRKIAGICDENGLKSYLTVNTIVYDEDIALMHEIVNAAKEAKISAIIASDMATILYARSIDVEVHISTQVNVSNSEAARFYAQYADVLVLARELNLTQVAGIYDTIQRDNICGPHGERLRIEMFCHGALCMAVSGKCYLSLHEMNSLVIVYIRRVLGSKDRPAHVQRLLADFEITADKDLAISKTLTKMGPMLGLMGTLIPMGPALVGLSTGDIASMAYNMQVAFATTVVGLFSSAIGFITQQVKQRWYLQDMTNLEFLSELLTEKHTA